MPDIELVIKIPEKIYKYVQQMGSINMLDTQQVANAIFDGTPLPKGHGRIGDLDALRCENTDFDTYNDYCTMFDEIDAAETIIEADTAESEK